MKNKEIKLNKIWLPLGFVDDGLGDDTFVDDDGTVWYGTTQEEVSYMWNY